SAQEASPLASREAQTKRSNPNGEIEPDLATHRDRLQRRGPVGAANQNIGAEACPNACLSAGTDIVAGEDARAGDCVGEHPPYHHAAAGHAEIKAVIGDRAVIILLPSWLVRVECAGDLLLGRDDHPDPA